jgi:hypothetical protein
MNFTAVGFMNNTEIAKRAEKNNSEMSVIYLSVFFVSLLKATTVTAPEQNTEHCTNCFLYIFMHFKT